ncbi:uncharacterized protein [Montipora foliosa]|uniref:uncharacterized protein isoform X2 n=1 Tax=Montipora foliosa TaxID=591990 RepID=UPI0035F18664
MYNFNLHFNQQWSPQQLIRSGGEKDPLQQRLRIASTNQYGDAMNNPPERIPRRFDFRVDQDGFILPSMSTGLSTFTSVNNFPRGFNLTNANLWRLETRPAGDAGHVCFPAEMQLEPNDPNATHYCIKPHLHQRVRHETFRQMLRCLPWKKMY